MNQVDQSKRDEAFAVLRQTVDEFFGNGRRALGAAVKPELVRKTFGGFSESALGFSSFGDFVRAAQAQGIVDVHSSRMTPDLELLPPGEQPQPQPDDAAAVDTQRPATYSPPGQSIRTDLWRAFVDWTPGLMRAYDREQDRAVFFPEEPAPLEPEEHRAARDAWKSNPERFPRIEPIGMARQIEWMQDFTERQPRGPARTILEFALSRDRPFREFSHAIREDSGLVAAWHVHRKELVADCIRKWMADNDLKVSIFKPVWMPHGGDTARETRPAADPHVEMIRQRLHRVIDRMTAADLLRLSIPVEYLIEQ